MSYLVEVLRIILRKLRLVIKMKDLEKRINDIEARNKRVELDKRWETSFTRRISICILTYIVVLLFSYFINKSNNIFLSSLVPVIGFTLSTLSVGLIRKIWLNVINKK